MVLLVAIVAAIALTLRRRKQTRYQDPSDQLSATKAGRLRIVKSAPARAGEGAAGPGNSP